MSSPARMGARGSWMMASKRKRAPAQRREERATSSPMGHAIISFLGVVIGLFLVVGVVVVEVDEEAADEEGIEEAEAAVKVMVAMKRRKKKTKVVIKEMCRV